MDLLITKFIKFGVVGASGIAVDFFITYLLKERVKINKYLANSAGFIVAASSNYILNRIWTFASNNPNILNEYFAFIFVSVLGLTINSLVLWYFVNKNMNFYVSKLIAITFTMIWNFSSNMYFTFK